MMLSRVSSTALSKLAATYTGTRRNTPPLPGCPAAAYAERYATRFGASSDSVPVRTAQNRSNPWAPIAGNVSGLVAATRMGGCGCWYGLGTTFTSWYWKYLPSNENVSDVQARLTISRVSAKRSRLSAYGTP